MPARTVRASSRRAWRDFLFDRACSAPRFRGSPTLHPSCVLRDRVSHDKMNKTAKVIALFEVRSFEPQMQQMGEDALAAAKLVNSAMPLLRNVGKNAAALNSLTEQIVRVEERADELHDEGRKALFLANRQNSTGGMNFTIGTEIYDHLEKVVDRLEDVANEINALVVDHL